MTKNTCPSSKVVSAIFAPCLCPCVSCYLSLLPPHRHLSSSFHFLNEVDLEDDKWSSSSFRSIDWSIENLSSLVRPSHNLEAISESIISRTQSLPKLVSQLSIGRCLCLSFPLCFNQPSKKSWSCSPAASRNGTST